MSMNQDLASNLLKTNALGPLSLRTIVKEFQTPDKKTVRAVNDISLELAQGKFHTLLGPSGCGKTTLLRMIAGFEQPTSGDILFEGQRLNDIPPQKRGFSMVFQSYALFPHMNVVENISYGLKIKRLSRSEIEARVDQAIALLDLRGHEKKFPHQMSGGQQQRVALARAMVMEPKIILFDEPLSNLDAKLRVFMRDEIRALQKRLGITAIYVTHDQEEAMAISDQIVVLNRGVVEQVGSPVDIYRRPSTEFVAKFIGSANVIETHALSRVQFRLLGAEYDFVENSKSPSNKVVIRSESIRISRAHGRHKAVVENAVFLGSRVNYTLNVEGQNLSADLAWDGRDELYQVGERVTFDIDTSALHFI